VDVVLASYQTLASDFKLMKDASDETSEAKKERDTGDKDDQDDPEVGKTRAKKKQKVVTVNRWIFDLCFHRLVLDEAVRF
jgi:hypothetical protein